MLPFGRSEGVWPSRRAASASIILLASASLGCTEWLGFGTAVGGDVDSGLPTVVFVSSGPAHSLPAEEAAAWAWLQEQPAFASRHLQLVDLPRESLPRDAILWWHYAEEESLPSAAVRTETLAAVRRHLGSGGRLLLTVLAASYTVPLGIETLPPDSVSTSWRGTQADLSAGFQSRLGHPLLAPFWGGVSTSTPNGDRSYPAALYTGDRWPADGRVWAVHKNQREVDSSTKIGIEYPRSEGRRAGTVLTMGAHCYFSDAGNRNRRQLEELVAAALHYLSDRPVSSPPRIEAPAARPSTPQDPIPGASSEALDSARQPGEEEEARPVPPVLDGVRRYWDSIDTGDRIRRVEIAPGRPVTPADPASVINAVAGVRSGAELVRYPTSDEPFTLASRRAFATGSQLGRVDEFWAHPLRLLRKLRFGVVRPERGITWLDDSRAERTFTARPEGNELRYTDGDIDLTLRVALDRTHPAMVALLAIRSPASVDLVASWEIDNTATWPRAGSLVGPLQLGWDEGLHAALWQDDKGEFAAMAGFGVAPSRLILGYSPEEDLLEEGLRETDDTEAIPAEAYGTRGIAAQLHVEPGRPALVPFIVVGGLHSEATVRAAFAELVANPGRPWADNAAFFRDFLDTRTLRLISPNEEINRSFRWAKLGIEALRGAAPELGAGIFSGYAPRAARDAWLAPQNTFGGGEALWASMAADAYGDASLAADTLRLLARYQGIDGRIPSAISPSWNLHYDRLESGPLFVIALERHLSTWGDRELLEQLWPTVVAVLEWGDTADRDGDGVIDAFGDTDRWHASADVSTTIYLGALWGAALDAAQRMAGWVGDSELAALLRERADRVRQILNEEFWDPQGRHFQFGRRADGTFVGARTILPAIPMIFGLLDSGRAIPPLDSFASAELTTDWGVAFAYDEATTADAPLEATAGPSDPDAGGPPATVRSLVSPLFTGWASLAEYANHRAEAGFLHLVSNLRLLASTNPGYAPEAFSRERYAPAGDVAHSAAAQAMTVLPVVHGMLGIRPLAMEGTLEIIPHLPAGWERVIADPVRLGNDQFRVRISQTRDRTQFVIERREGSDPVRFRLGARVPVEVDVSLDPELVGADIVEQETIVRVGVDDQVSIVVVRPTESQSTVTFVHDPFPQVIPAPAQLTEGGPSTGLRIVRSRYLGGTLSVELEGLPGRSYALRLATPWPVSQVTGVPGASIADQEPGSATIEAVIPGSGKRYRRVELKVSFQR